MNIEQLRTKYRDSILQIAEDRNIEDIRIFGSVARGDNDVKSDIDFLVHLNSEADLLDLSGFGLDVEELLKCKIDVVPDNSIHWSIKDKILKEAITLS
ncbi:MAG: putative nucleotidyltransferase [Rickettsiales bacterium]|jgi:predicted nucleotidyltransferase